MTCSKKRRNRRSRKPANQVQVKRQSPTSGLVDELSDGDLSETLTTIEDAVQSGDVPVDACGLFELRLQGIQTQKIGERVQLHQVERAPGNPFASLTGYTADESACGLAMVIEGALDPSSNRARDLIPHDDDDPTRFRVRAFSIVMRDGRVLEQLQLLGGKRQGQRIEGYGEPRLHTFMKRALGVEVDPPDRPARVFWARMWVEAALTGLSKAKAAGQPLDTQPWRPRPVSLYDPGQRDATASHVWPGWVNHDGTPELHLETGVPEVVMAHDKWKLATQFIERMARKGRAGELTPERIRWMGSNLLARELLDRLTTPLGDSLPALAELDALLADELKTTFAELEVNDFEPTVVS
jgi:hypothetical protein